jgi:hypothetical protein
MEYTITSKTPDKLEEKLAQYKKLTALREDLTGRLEKAEAQKDSVTPKIFEKVRSEYHRKLENVEEQLSPIQSDLENAKKECEEQIPLLEDEITMLEDELAEAEFRFRVGEYAQTRLTEIQTRLNPDLAERTDRHEHFCNRLKAIEEGFSDETATDAPSDTPTKKAKPAETGSKNETPETDGPTDTPEEPAADGGNSSRVTLESTDPLEALTDRKKDGAVDDGERVAPPAGQEDDTTDAGAETEEDSPATSFENPQDWIDELGDRDSADPSAAGDTDKPGEENEGEKDKDDPLSALADPKGDPGDDDAPGKEDVSKNRDEISVGFPNMVIITGPSSGKKIPLLPMTMSIGREHDNNIELKDPDVGRYHARILYDRGRFILEDLESSNGTWLNGEKISEAALKNGDRIKMGEIELAIDFD